MKRTLIALAAIAALSGCAGLSLNADFYGTYRSDIQPGTYGGTAKRPAAAPAPAAAPVVPGAPS